jgi:YVTN family beta-propeller protein
VAELRRSTVTFVFTDIEGSTRLARALRERWPDVRSVHRRLVRAAFESHGGEEVDTQGDSFFYVFPRARDAALAAAEAQRGLAAQEWPDEGEVRIRIGMHTGEPVVSDEGYHGIGVHRAARIMAAGHGGQVLMSEATAAVLADEEITGVGVRDLGRHQLKDIERGEHVYQLVADGLDQQFPRIRSAARPRPMYRRPLVIGAAAGVLAAAISIPVFAFAGGSGGEAALAAVDGNAVGVVGAASGALRAQTSGVESPQGVATGADAVWVSSAEGTIVRLDPKNHEVDETIDVRDGPQGLAVSGNDVWVANSLDGTVSRVSAETNREVEHYTVGNTPTGVAVGGGSVWITNAGDGTVTQLDAASGAVKRTIDVHAPVHGIAYGGRSLWVSDPVGNGVVRLRVGPSFASTRIPVGSGPTAIAYGGGRVWVANNLDGTVSRIDPTTDIVSGTFPVGASPNGIAVTSEDVWVSDEVEGTLARVDPETGDAEPSKLGGRPEGVGVTDGSVWVAVQAAGEAHRGGDLRLLAPIDFVDPALAYFPPTWTLLSVTGDGLVDFKRVGGIDGNTLVPNLATRLPQPSDGGRTYSFQLRDGIRFSDGRGLRPADVRATFERLFRAFAIDERKKRVTSPRLDFYTGIIGGQACQKRPKTCDLSRGIVTNDADRTVTFHLEKPDRDFLHKLALPFGYIVPAGTPVGRDRPTPGTGPYRFARYTPHRRAQLERNPYFRLWSARAQPPGLVDTIDMSTNLTGGKGEPASALAAFRATAAGRLDVAVFGPPAEALETARTRYPAQLHITPIAQTEYVVLNTQRAPFGNPLARRALAFALDRQRLVDLRGGNDLGGPTCQLLSPGFPGYRPYCPYTLRPSAGTWSAPDFARARAAVDRSGTRGARVHMITTDETNTGYRLLSEEVAATLRALGYRVFLEHFATDEEYFNAFFNDWRRIDAAPNGWFPDYPAPAAFFNALGCATNTYTCSPALERRMARAAAAAGASGSNDPWTQLDREVANGAFVVPTLNPKANDFVSKRLGNYQRHPVFGVLFDQVWVQ